MTAECYKCKKRTQALMRINYQFRCGMCKDYDNGMHFAMGTNNEDKSPFPECGCPAICRECKNKKCHACGNVKRENTDDFASDCKICGTRNMSELSDKSDTDRRGNWIDKYENAIGSCEECVYCNNKTVCRKCAIAKFEKEKNQSEEIKDLQKRIKILEEKL